MPKGRQPDFNLWAGNDNAAGKCGAAWKNDDGSISIVLDKWSVMYGKGHPGAPVTIKLFPADYKKPEPAPKAAGSQKTASLKGKFDDLEDDIPF